MQLQLLHTSGAAKIWQKNWRKPVGHRSLKSLIGTPILPASGFLRFSHKDTQFSTLFAEMNYH